jgi:hypothetical protein
MESIVTINNYPIGWEWLDKIPLANFLNEDQGYESGISMYGHYIACKCLDISSEEEYMNQLTDIRILTNHANIG